MPVSGATKPKLDSEMRQRFSRLLLAWFSRHGRQLPWRGHRDPYSVWISEIMLQQTRVDTVRPYFSRWLRRFPSIGALARAKPGEVLLLWEGLGYYSRARNLHRAARIVMGQHGGHLPSTLEELRLLPGIGGYTAAAIASIAFGAHVPAVDGNVKRVFARVFGIRTRVDHGRGARRIADLANALVPKRRAGDFNEALMDLGATVCLPRQPRCSACPLRTLCGAYQCGTQDVLPVRPSRESVPHKLSAAAVIQKDGRVLLAQRPTSGLLGGMWQFPSSAPEVLAPSRDLPSVLSGALLDEHGLRIRPLARMESVHHSYSHFRLTLQAYVCSLQSRSIPRTLRWVEVSALNSYPMGKVDREIARKVASISSSRTFRRKAKLDRGLGAAHG